MKPNQNEYPNLSKRQDIEDNTNKEYNYQKLNNKSSNPEHSEN